MGSFHRNRVQFQTQIFLWSNFIWIFTENFMQYGREDLRVAKKNANIFKFFYISSEHPAKQNIKLCCWFFFWGGGGGDLLSSCSRIRIPNLAHGSTWRQIQSRCGCATVIKTERKNFIIPWRTLSSVSSAASLDDSAQLIIFDIGTSTTKRGIAVAIKLKSNLKSCVYMIRKIPPTLIHQT